MRCLTALISGLALLSMATEVRAFSFLGFPSLSRILSDQIHRWPDYPMSQPTPFVLTYAIDPDFLINEDQETRDNALATIQAALHSWEVATHGMVLFVPAPFGPVEMGLDEDGQPPSAFVGQPFDDWLNQYIACNFDPECIAQYPPPGWGAHIDFFSKPQGYGFTFIDENFLMTDCNLGFTAIYPEGTTGIRSVDIYLNERWDWTTDAAEVTPLGPGGAGGVKSDGETEVIRNVRHEELTDSHDHSASPVAPRPGGTVEVCDFRPAGAERFDDRSCSGLTYVIDLQSVIVHEVGHALGLDHPDEAVARGSVNLDPFTVTPKPPGPVDTSIVMHSVYTGLKRNLTNDDIGGMASLYPPDTLGDIDGDGEVGYFDVWPAMKIYEGSVAPNPWVVRRCDFITPNGKIDLDELQTLLLWFGDPGTYPAGVLPSLNVELWTDRAITGPTSVTITGATNPSDIGLGGTVDLFLMIDNPDALSVLGFDFRVNYNKNVLLNPRYVAGRDFLVGQPQIPLTLTSVDATTNQMRLGAIGFTEDSQTAGILAVVRFDIDLVAADAVPSVSFPYTQVDVVVADPYPHNFGLEPALPDETLSYSAPTALAYRLDIDGDHLVTINDLYAWNLNPVDVNKDGQVTTGDQWSLKYTLRGEELYDMAPDREPSTGN